MYWLKINLFIFFIGFILTQGCNPGTESIRTVKPEETFSLSKAVVDIFEAGIEDSIQSSVTKTIMVNETNPEKKQLSDYNIKSDLADINDFDFSSLRWFEGYDLVTTDSSGFEIHTYSTENTKAPADKVKIIYGADGEVVEINIQEEKKSLVSRQNFAINWKVESGYSIYKKSYLLFKDPATFEMKLDY